METLRQLYTDWSGQEPTSINQLPVSGSNRRYFRLTGTKGNAIGVIGTSADEDNTFIYLANHFVEKDLPMPHIYQVATDGLHYLQEDFGKDSLYDALRSGRERAGIYNTQQINLLKKVMQQLPLIQVKGAEGLDWDKCYPLPAMDRASIQFDLNYFKYDFLKLTGIEFHELKLELDMHRLTDDLLYGSCDTFIYRDFQARNIMLVAGEPRFIDFQGGRRGPIYYDVASFLWQASAQYSPTLRNQLLDVYLESLEQVQAVDRAVFYKQLNLFVLFRLLQVLGAYGFRGLIERKPYFLNSIAPALANLKQLLSECSFEYDYLISLLQQLCEMEKIQLADYTLFLKKKEPEDIGAQSVSKFDGQGELTVRVYSFSYKKGIPEDTSGNGGGYVFDCRSTTNPGRYDRYKPMTGLDQAVKDFLEQDGDILLFLEKVYSLADTHVERYMKRGFTDLMFCFGCTGGRHRSVYSAQHVAEHIHNKYGIKVVLEHREQGIKEVLA